MVLLLHIALRLSVESAKMRQNRAFSPHFAGHSKRPAPQGRVCCG
ncbi:hypothetical protein HMPREF9123_1639 [Neisseria bacilliformis ATCC BAA-1200]|uniref:Uncharacterized protein n=1 Tax=Neisseria bacilliformis ATCC BAA-1200 TaxID=888742 RepID=F2BD33_9NEIS|nr:hypothetical protein HMPREF9123_1639 [Neisseria bacilliformis ATCC BAA-1200]